MKAIFNHIHGPISLITVRLQLNAISSIMRYLQRFLFIESLNQVNFGTTIGIKFSNTNRQYNESYGNLK